MGNPLTTVEEYISRVVHHTREAVKEAEARVKVAAEAEKVKLAGEVRGAVAALDATVKADAPVVEAELKKAVADALTALEAVLAAKGL